MDILFSPLYQGPTSGQFIKSRKQRIRSSQSSGFRGLSAKDNMLKNLTNVLQTYPVQSEAESLAMSVMGMEGIQNMNVEYLSAALYLYKVYGNSYSTSKKSKSLKITPKMFDDETNPIKIIKDRLNKSIKISSEKRERDLWVRRKQNIFVYFQTIIKFLAEEHIKYIPSETYSKQRLKQQEEDEEDEEDLELELAQGDGYSSDVGREGSEDMFDPAD